MTRVPMSTPVRFAATNPVQQDGRTTCAVCGVPVVRAPRARGPLPRECPSCRAASRRRRQLRAYLRSAGRIAEERGMHELEDMISRAVSAVDREEER
jgi:hypothetical protein